MNLVLRVGPPADGDRTLDDLLRGGWRFAAGRVELGLDEEILAWADRHEEKGPDGETTGFAVLFGYVFDGERALGAREIYEADLAAPALRSTLSGLYCLFRYSKAKGRLEVVPDFYGTGTPSWAAAGPRLLVGSRAAFVAELAGSALHAQAFLQQANGVNSPTASTVFSEVERFPFDASLSIDAASGEHRWIRQDDWKVAFAPEDFARSVERSIELLSALGARTARQPRTAVDLTAGNDTRLIAAGLSRHDLAPGAVTFRVSGTEDHVDAVVARRIVDHFGWSLRRMTRKGFTIPDDDALESLCLRADAKVPLDDMANRVEQETAWWSDHDHLLSGLGLEMFRGWYFQYELLRKGRPDIHYASYYRHRMSGSKSVPEWLAGRLGIDDEALRADTLAPVEDVADRLAGSCNVVKLDQVGHVVTAKRIMFWNLLDLMQIQCPILEGPFSLGVRAIPWRHRSGRRLNCSVVERLSPWLSSFPTDLGAPFRTLRPSNALDYLRFHVRNKTDILLRHYLSSGVKPTHGAAALRRSLQETGLAPWIRRWTEELRPWLPLELASGELDRDLAEDADGRISESSRRKYLQLISLGLLLRAHPGIRRSFVDKPSSMGC